MVRVRTLLILLLLAGLPLAPLSAQAASELFVQQDSVLLKVGQRAGLSVQAYDEKGDAVLDIKYLVRDQRIARVESGGTITALAPGRTKIVIQAGKKSKTIDVLVAGTPEPTLKDLSVQPASLTLLPTEIGHLTVTGTRADGVPVTTMHLTWKATRPEVAALSDTLGTIIAVGAGQGTIEVFASSGPVVGVPVAVALTPLAFEQTSVILNVGDADSLAVVVPAQGNRRLPASTLVWRTSDSTIVTIEAAGLIRAVGSGQATILASGFLQDVRLTITVRPQIARFVLSPPANDAIRIPLGTARQFGIRAESADSTPITGVQFSWLIGDSAVVAFDSLTGLLTARGIGRTTLEASTPGYKHTIWNVEVVAGAVALDRPRVALGFDSTTHLVATLMDDQGTSLGAIPRAAWRSSDTSVVTVDSTGTLHARGLGSAIVTVTGPGGKSASSTVYVTGDLLVSSSRHGGYGIYAVAQGRSSEWVPIVADGATNVQASYSPDRTRIVYSSDKGGAGNFDIWVADADGLNPQRLTSEPGLDNTPVWTPDGKRIVFTSSRAGHSQIYSMTTQGTDVHALTGGTAATQEPAISADGAELAYVVFREGTSGVVTRAMAETSEPTAPLARDRREGAPRFLHDGSVAYLVERKSGANRYQIVTRPAGSDSVAVVVASEKPITFFSIAPDGGKLVYVTTQVGDRTRPNGTLYLRPAAGAPFAALPGQPAENLASPSL
ncbi:MAG: Ig-like domain-containing protein [Gemmatimonadota bacterium]